MNENMDPRYVTGKEEEITRFESPFLYLFITYVYSVHIILFKHNRMRYIAHISIDYYM